MSYDAPPPNIRCKILYVDDELLSLKYFKQIVGEEFQVITAASAEEAMAIVAESSESIAIVVSDQRLTGTPGTAFLSSLKDAYPNIIRILATAYSDIATAVAAINHGAIYQYISKPWDPDFLIQTIRRALDTYILTAERERLLKERTAMARQLIASDRLAGYGALAEGINHHIRNALVPMQTFLQLTSDTSNPVLEMDDGFMNELRLEANIQMKRITDMLSQLATVATITNEDQADPVNLDDLWKDQIERLTSILQDHRISVYLHNAEGPIAPIYCNQERLSQILRLVLENSLEHLAPTHDVHISLRNVPAAEEQGAHVSMSVWDTGPDVPVHRLNSMFTPFFMRPESPHYTGMHLASAYMMLHNLGGWAQASHDTEKGTVITLCFPLRTSICLGGKPSPETIQMVMNAETV